MRGLGLPCTCVGTLLIFFCLSPQFHDEVMLIKGSLCVYAVYSGRNSIMHGQQVTSDGIYRFLLNLAQQGVLRHKCAKAAFSRH